MESPCAASERAAMWKTAGVSSPAILYMFGIISSRPCDAVNVVASEPVAPGSSEVRTLFASVLAPGEVASAPNANFTVELQGVSSYTGIIARRDPASGIVWLAAALIMVGLTLTLRRPRARLWIRIRPDRSHAEAALLLDRGARAEQAAPLLGRIAATLSARGDDARTVSA